MRNPAELVLNGFLTHCPPEKKKKLEAFLPESERLRLEGLPALAKKPSPEGFTNGPVLEQVHWSWFLPTLKTYTEKEQKFFLSAIASQAPQTAQNLAQSLDIAVPKNREEPEKMKEPARNYLRQILIDSLVGPKDRLLPIEYLPSSPLNLLLTLSKKELTRVIDLLSLHDLAAELRQIVETKMLKKIYSILTEEERKFLKTAMSKEASLLPRTSSRIGLERWDGSEESFRVLLHKRGLARFGAALSGQDPDFIWHICHHLDIGRGNALFKLCSKEASSDIADAMVRQIEEILKS